MKKRRFSDTLQGAIAGGSGGAVAGSAGGPAGTLLGGLAGAALGGFAGNLESQANDPYNDLNIEDQTLSNEEKKLRVEQQKRMERGMGIFRGYLSSAFGNSSSPSSFSSSLKTYPGLGNQGVA
jgi:hypothetical protein